MPAASYSSGSDGRHRVEQALALDEALEAQAEVLDHDAAEVAARGRAALVAEDARGPARAGRGRARPGRRSRRARGRSRRSRAGRGRSPRSPAARERLDVAPPDPLRLRPAVHQQERVAALARPHDTRARPRRAPARARRRNGPAGGWRASVHARESYGGDAGHGLRSRHAGARAGDPLQPPHRASTWPRSATAAAWCACPTTSAAQPRRLAARRRAVLGRRGGFRRRVRGRLRRAHGRDHAARPHREISYLKLAQGPITATGTLGEGKARLLERLDADGKVEFPVEVELTDDEGTTVAEMTVHWHVRKNA